MLCFSFFLLVTPKSCHNVHDAKIHVIVKYQHVSRALYVLTPSLAHLATWHDVNEQASSLFAEQKEVWEHFCNDLAYWQIKLGILIKC